MNISPGPLGLQVTRARSAWPFISDVERAYGLPPWLLFAVGSRETNLTNEVGDGGHGHGVWQLDDRWHTIPPGFDQDVYVQAVAAASELRGLLDRYGNVQEAANAYNSGQPYDAGTTGGDYGPDVVGRMAWCAAHLAPPPPPPPPLPSEVDMAKDFEVIQDATGKPIAVFAKEANNHLVQYDPVAGGGWDRTDITITAPGAQPLAT